MSTVKWYPYKVRPNFKGNKKEYLYSKKYCPKCENTQLLSYVLYENGERHGIWDECKKCNYKHKWTYEEYMDYIDRR